MGVVAYGTLGGEHYATQLNNMDLTNRSLNEVEQLLQQCRISRDQAVAWVRLWNAGPHLTQAIVRNGRIKNMDPEVLWKLYPANAEECQAKR